MSKTLTMGEPFVIRSRTAYNRPRQRQDGPGVAGGSSTVKTSRAVERRVLGRFPDREKPLPPAWKMARNLAGSVAKTVSAALAGQKVAATDEERASREAVCRENRCGRYRASDGRCSACGCYAKAKAWLWRESCPVGLW